MVHDILTALDIACELCRMEETLLDAYGADGHRGSAKERVKLQSEMDRAIKQVPPYNAC